MIDVKEAVKSAMFFMNNLYNQEDLQDLMLEEVELSAEGDYWYITLSFIRAIPHGAKPQRGALQDYLRPPTVERVYKTISVKMEDETATAMKIRSVVDT